MSLETLARRVRRCRKCRLWKTRGRAVPGEGDRNARIFLVGEAPGREEDEQGRPFIGAAGKILNEALKKADLKREGVFITSVLRCRPPRNRNPRKDEIEKCRPYLEAYIDAVDPYAVVALGSFAHKALAGRSAKVSEARLETREYEGRPLISTYHPAAVLYNRRLLKHLTADLKRAKKFAESEDTRIISRSARRGKGDVSIRAAGGVIHRRGRILLIRKKSERLWCLPKGHVETGESLEHAALREMKEETGLWSIRIERELCDIDYSYYWPQDDVNYRKKVTYYLARAPKGRPGPEFRFDRHKWCTEAEAAELLFHQNDVNVARKAFEAIRK
jgi:DNA polymerase